MCDAKTSAVMVLCEAKGFGGEEDVELLWEPWGKGLLDRFEGLVLPGLGLEAMSSFVRQRTWAAVAETKAATEAASTRGGRVARCGAVRCGGQGLCVGGE